MKSSRDSGDWWIDVLVAVRTGERMCGKVGTGKSVRKLWSDSEVVTVERENVLERESERKLSVVLCLNGWEVKREKKENKLRKGKSNRKVKWRKRLTLVLESNYGFATKVMCLIRWWWWENREWVETKNPELTVSNKFLNKWNLVITWSIIYT
jgi:hypothetical protein